VKQALKTEISQLVGILLIAGAIGHLTQHPGYLLAAGLLAYALKHALHLVRLTYLVSHRQPIDYPYPVGVWRPIYREIDRLRNRSRKRKRILNRFANRFRKVASIIPDAYVLLDKNARLEWANPAARRLLGVHWPRDEGVPLTQLLDYPDLQEYLTGADYQRSLEFASPVNQGVILSLRITPFGGKKVERLLVARDITELYHLNQARRDFVSNVSHELRTPLTIISGFLETLSENNPQPFQQRPFNLMLQQSQRMNSIIDDLLTLSKLEMGEQPVNAPVAVAALIRKIVDQASILAEQRGGYPFSMDLDPDLYLLGNRQELESAFSNLIFNAVIHTPPNTRIHIDWQREVDALKEASAAGKAQWAPAVLRVADSGPGIPERHIARLTERFYRVDKGRSRESGGTGLGLAIVKHIVHRHDGELIITSREGYGSEFACVFDGKRSLEGGEVTPRQVERTD